MVDSATNLIVFGDKNIFLDDNVSSFVNARKNPDGSLQYSYANHYKIENNELPKLHSVLLDPNLSSNTSKNNDEVIASLLYKRYQSIETNLTAVKEHLYLMNANFTIRNITEEATKQVLFDVVRIYTNSSIVIGSFSNLYLYRAKSIEASAILNAALIQMVHYIYNQSNSDEDKKILAQDFGIKMSYWADPEEFLLTKPIFQPTNRYCYENKSFEYIQQEKYFLEKRAYKARLQEYNFEYQRYITDSENKQVYINFSEEKKMDLFNKLLEIDSKLKVKAIVDGIIRDNTEEKIHEMYEKRKSEEVSSIFETVEQCKTFLCGQYPEVEEIGKNITYITIKEFKRLENRKWSIENVAKNTKDFTSIISTLVFDFAIGSAIVGSDLMGQASPVIGTILNTGKVAAIAAGLGLRNSWISPKEESTIDKPKLIEDFVCKATLCNIEDFLNMTIEKQDEVGKSYANHIYYSLLKDKTTYSKQSTIVDAYLMTYDGNHDKGKCLEVIRKKLGINKIISETNLNSDSQLAENLSNKIYNDDNIIIPDSINNSDILAGDVMNIEAV
jgi:hypothetical protein